MHWGPWITPAPQSFSLYPAAARAGLFTYTPSSATMADTIAAPAAETHSPGSAAWRRADAGPNIFLYSVVNVDVSLGLSQYAQEYGFGEQNGFYNASPSWPSGVVAIEHEVTWDHTHYAEMLASISGDISVTIRLAENDPGSMVMEDVNVFLWVTPPSGLSNVDTTFGYVGQTAGVPTQSDLDGDYTARAALVAFPTSTTADSVTLSVPLASFYTGMLPYRADLAPAVRISAAIHEGVQGIDPAAPSPGFTSGRLIDLGSSTVAATYTPPRYRFQYTRTPLLRQRQVGAPSRQRQTPTASVRQGPGRIR